MLITDIFDTIGNTVSGFFTVLNNGINDIVELFYITTNSGGSFTFLGNIFMVGLGIGLVWTLIKWISGLVRNVAR